MSDGTDDIKVNSEVIKELRDDFTFFIASSMLKTVALNSPDPQNFVKEVVWKWREQQVNALGIMVASLERKLKENSDLYGLFGEVAKQASKERRESIITNLRIFSDSIEKILLSGLNEAAKEKEEEDPLD